MRRRKGWFVGADSLSVSGSAMAAPGDGTRMIGVFVTWQTLDPSAGLVYSVTMIVVLQLFGPLDLRPTRLEMLDTFFAPFCVCDALLLSSLKA